MKNKKVLILSIIINILLILLVCSLISKNGNIVKEKQIVKEMNESTQVTDLNNQINSLNSSHTEYAEYIQECKKLISNAITKQGIDTSINSTIEEVVTNIGNILKVRTKDATATADNITEGKTAWVNGELITGTGTDNKTNYNQGLEDAKQTSSFTINITAKAIVQSNSNNFMPSGGSKTITATYRYENGTLNFSSVSGSSNFKPDSVSNSGSFRVTTYIDNVEIIFD